MLLKNRVVTPCCLRLYHTTLSLICFPITVYHILFFSYTYYICQLQNKFNISYYVHSCLYRQHFHTEIILDFFNDCSQRIHSQQLNIPVMSLACNSPKPYMWKNKQSCPDGCLCSRTGKPRDNSGFGDTEGKIRLEQQSQNSPRSVRKMNSH